MTSSVETYIKCILERIELAPPEKVEFMKDVLEEGMNNKNTDWFTTTTLIYNLCVDVEEESGHVIQEEDSSKSNGFECPVCFSASRNTIACEFGHAVCKSCFKRNWEVKYNDGSEVVDVKCCSYAYCEGGYDEESINVSI